MLPRVFINFTNNSFRLIQFSSEKSAIYTSTISQFINMSTTRVPSSSSFEKVLESPFSLKNVGSGSGHSHKASCRRKGSKKSSSIAKVKIKSRSAPTGKKLRRKKSTSGTSSVKVGVAPTRGHISRKSYMLSSPTSPTGHTPSHTIDSAHSTTTRTQLAKIDSPDLSLADSICKSSKAPQITLQTIKQSQNKVPPPLVTSASRDVTLHSPQGIKSSYSTNSQPKNLHSKSSPSVSFKLKNSSVGVKLSRNFSSIPPIVKHHNSARTIRKNAFCLHNGVGRGGVTGSSSYDGSTFTIYELAQSLKLGKFKKIVVMSGAGISTASGIPDFRTPGTGLYDNLKQYQIPEPSAIFDITFFVKNPRPFFTLAKELYPGSYPPNIAHHFIKLLQDKELLLRHYTQNIDGLERLAGIKPGRLVESHGSFATASCSVCQSKHDPLKIKEMIFQNKVPHCKHKLCMGIVKPDIVFFGEDLPPRFHALRYSDLAACDLLIVMGTSLEVEPFASLVTSTKYDVPRVLMNREIVGPFKQQRKRAKDITLTGDLSERITELARLTGWTEDLNMLEKKYSSQTKQPSLAEGKTAQGTEVHNVCPVTSPLSIDKSHDSSEGSCKQTESKCDGADGGSDAYADIINDISKLNITDKN